MSKNLLAAATLCVCSLATAAPKDFEVDYYGFFNPSTNVFDPAAHLQLVFTADDTNADGTYTIDELLMFGMDRIYTTQPLCVYLSCVYNFTYTPGSAPVYSASYYISDERFAQSTVVESGDYYEILDRSVSSPTYHQRLEWTSATQTWVNGELIPVVPEPATYAMLGLGLGALYLAGRRNRRTG